MPADQGRTPSPQELTQHLEFVRGVALALVNDPELAEDLSQEAILAALKRPPRLRQDIRSWFRGVVRNLARVHYRESSRRTRRERAIATERGTGHPGFDTIEEAFGRAELRQRIAQAVLDLEEPYRGILILRYMESLTPTEIAELTGRPVATVKTHLQRGLERLRLRLDREEGGRAKWRQSLLWLLLPLTAIGTSASAAEGPLEGTAAIPAASGAGAFFGSLAWVPLLSVVGIAIWFTVDSIPDAPPGPVEEPPVVEESMTPGAAKNDAPHATTSSPPESAGPPTVAEPPAAKAAGREVLVRNERGEPVGGARIVPLHTTFLVSTDESGFTAHRIAMSSSVKLTAAVEVEFSDVSPETVTTDFEGRAVLPLTTRTEMLSVFHPDYLSTQASIGGGSVDPIVVILDSGIPITILVLEDGSGRPVAGAMVAVGETRSAPDSPIVENWLTDVSSPPVAFGMISRFEAVAPNLSDERGEAIVIVRPGGRHSLRVTAEGWGEFSLSSVDLEAEDPFIVSLDREATLRIERSGADLGPESLTLETATGARSIEFPEGESTTILRGLAAGHGVVQRSAPELLGELSVEGRALVQRLSIIVPGPNPSLVESKESEFRAYRVQLHSGEETTLDLDPSGMSTVEVAIEPLSAVEGATLLLVDEGGETIAVAASTPFGFRFDGVPTGPHRLALRLGAVLQQERSIDVVSGPNSIPWSLPTGGLVVTGLDPDTPIELRPQGGLDRPSSVWPSGWVEWSHLPPGPAELWAVRGDRLEHRSVTIDAGIARLDWGPSITFEAEVEIRGESSAGAAYRAHLSPAWAQVRRRSIAMGLSGTHRLGEFDPRGWSTERWVVSTGELELTVSVADRPFSQSLRFSGEPNRAVVISFAPICHCDSACGATARRSPERS